MLRARKIYTLISSRYSTMYKETKLGDQPKLANIGQFGNNDQYLTQFRLSEQTHFLEDAYGRDDAFAAIKFKIARFTIPHILDQNDLQQP